MIVDMHAHFWSKGFIANAFHRATAEAWAKQAADRTPDMIMPKLIDGLVDLDGKMFIDNMDRAGVDVCFIQMTDFGGFWSGEEAETPLEEQIHYYSDLQRRYPGRLYCFFWADPRRKNCLELFEKAIKEEGLKGCGEFTTKDLYIYDERVKPLLRKCVELGVPVLFHSRTGAGVEMKGADMTIQNNGHPRHIRKVLDDYPELTVFIAHVGYPVWWEEAAWVARGYPNCYLELSNWNEDRADPASFIPKLACMRDMVGAYHICFGSDQATGSRWCSTAPATTA